MGLRVEQQNIEDLLKYFIARNEFKRKNIVEILKDLTDDERSKMNITNFAEFYSYYRFLYKLLREDIIDGVTTTIKNSEELVGKSYYEKDFLLKFPFQYILKQRLADDITKKYRFVYDDLDDTNIADGNPVNPSWIYVYDEDAVFNETYQFDVYKSEKVNLNDFGITLIGTPKTGDFITVTYTAFKPQGNIAENTKLEIDHGVLLSIEGSSVNTAVFGNKVKTYSNCLFDDTNEIDELFQKIIDSNPEIQDAFDGAKLISTEFTIENNTDNNCKLDDIFTFTSDIYYRSDKDEEGFTKLTKYTIILATLRKILDDRIVKYNKSDYLLDVKVDSYDNIISFDLTYENLLNLVLNTNPLTKDEVPDDRDYTFRSLQSEIANLKAYVNEYVTNETVNYENRYFIKKGKANYSGYSYCTTIPHNTGLQPMGTIINNVNPDDTKSIGDVYIKSDTKNIYIYNTGSNRSEFEFTTFFDPGEAIEFPIEKTFEDFVEGCINGITKIKLDDSVISKKDGKTIFNLSDGNGGTLFNKFDFLVISNADKEEFYYRVDDTELFDFNEEDNILTVISDSVKITDDDNYFITAMKIEDEPILYLLNNLMNNPNFYIQKIVNFMDLFFIPTDEDFEKYKTSVLGVDGVNSLRDNKKVKYVDLSSYDVTENDIIFINGLGYSLVDEEHFLFFTYTENDKVHNILLVYNIEIDSKDEIHLSRLTKLINPFDLTDDTSGYDFTKYVYINSKSSFGRGQFKKDVLLGEGHAEDKSKIKLDPSTRMYNRDPLTNRIEKYMTYGDYLIDVRVKDIVDTIRIREQSRFSVISHKLGNTPNFVVITPYADESMSIVDAKAVGNIWYDVDDENIYVYNSGDSECWFEWYAVYDEDCITRNNNYKDIDSDFNKQGSLFYNVTHNSDSKLEYIGQDYVTYDNKTKELVVYNTNINNNSYKYKLTYVTKQTEIENPKFLEYSENYTYNQNGYFDRNENIDPTGDRVLNYSGEFRSTKSKVFGNGIVQYLPMLVDDRIEVGSIVSYVDGICKVADGENYSTVVGVASDKNYAIAIDTYTKSKLPVGLYGIHYVKVIGTISAGQKLGLITDDTDLKGVATDGEIYVKNCYIGKALENYDNPDEVGLIKVLLKIN